MQFSRQEYQSRLPFPSPNLPDPGIKPMSPASPALASGFFTTEPPGNHSSNLWRLIFQCHVLFVFSYCSWGSLTGVVCPSHLQWTTFYQTSSLWPVCLEWPCTACFIASLSYTSPFTTTRLWSVKGRQPWLDLYLYTITTKKKFCKKDQRVTALQTLMVQKYECWKNWQKRKLY